jgi:hypothetical protein
VRSWGLSVQEQQELWRRWRQGESLRLIARRLGKRGPSVRAFVLQTGGVQRHPPCHRVLRPFPSWDTYSACQDLGGEFGDRLRLRIGSAITRRSEVHRDHLRERTGRRAQDHR